MSMYMGYHYNEPKRGNGCSLKAKGDRGSVLYFPSITKASALNIKKEMLNRGYEETDIDIEKN